MPDHHPRVYVLSPYWRCSSGAFREGTGMSVLPLELPCSQFPGRGVREPYTARCPWERSHQEPGVKLRHLAGFLFAFLGLQRAH